MMTVGIRPRPMWTPPAGWHAAAVRARQEREGLEYAMDDNDRRRERGLPEYGLPVPGVSWRRAQAFAADVAAASGW